MRCFCGTLTSGERNPLCHLHWFALPAHVRTAWPGAVQRLGIDSASAAIRAYAQHQVFIQSQGELLMLAGPNKYRKNNLRRNIDATALQQQKILDRLTGAQSAKEAA